MDTQCTGANLPFCNTTGGYCVECLNNGECLPDAKGGGAAGRPVCLSTTTMACVACTDDTTCAGATPHCNTANNTCVRCMIDAECADAGAASVCNLTTHTCGCPAGETLCTTGGGRGGDGAVTTGCYNTQTDNAHCGMCNNACNMNQACTAGVCGMGEGGTTDVVTPPG
jgi:hypothetical protein